MHDKLTLERILEILESRGFTLKLKADGTPVLHGDLAQATPALLAVLRRHREAIIARLKHGKPSQHRKGERA